MDAPPAAFKEGLHPGRTPPSTRRKNDKQPDLSPNGQTAKGRHCQVITLSVHPWLTTHRNTAKGSNVR